MIFFFLGIFFTATVFVILDTVFPLTFVSGFSMFPTYCDGDILIGSRLHRHRIDIGDVVVLRDPGDSDRLIIKRVHKIRYDGRHRRMVSIYVLGDNQSAGASRDSRMFGYVPVENLVTKILYPFRRKEDIPYDYGFGG